MGVREQIIYPEIDDDAIDHVRGLDITITISQRTDVEAFVLLTALGMPFSTYGRLAEFAASGPLAAGEPAGGADREARPGERHGTHRPGEHRLMAKTSLRVKQARTPRTRRVQSTRCSRCGLRRRGIAGPGSAASVCASSPTTARSPG